MRRLILLAAMMSSVSGATAEPVTIGTFVRAETDTAIRNVFKQIGFGKFFHTRSLASLDDQPVIRQNRDTLYSTAVLDLTVPATVTVPNTGGRYMSLHVINQDHYMLVLTKPGRHKLTEKMIGSRYAYLIVRTFVDPADQKDIAVANAAQDGLKIEGGGSGRLEAPDWDQDQLKSARQALNILAKMGYNSALAYGTQKETDPLQRLVGAAAGWGGLPAKNAFYEVKVVEKNDGTPHAVRVKDVPVDGFWSITVYNSKGYFDKNDRGAYSFNNVTSKPDKDGAITVHFGGCKDGRVNCLPISKGWNYLARMYQPRKEILEGSWKFPVPKPVK